MIEQNTGGGCPGNAPTGRSTGQQVVGGAVLTGGVAVGFGAVAVAFGTVADGLGAVAVGFGAVGDVPGLTVFTAVGEGLTEEGVFVAVREGRAIVG
jgi:hypothetical protein